MKKHNCHCSQGQKCKETHTKRHKMASHQHHEMAHRAEFGADMASNDVSVHQTPSYKEEHEKNHMKTTYGSMGENVGYVGIIFGVISLFTWPMLFGPIAVVLGYYSYMNKKRTIGAWSIGLGALSTLSYLFMSLFQY